MWNWKRLLHDAHFSPPLVRNAVSFTPRGSACSVWRSTWTSFPIRSRLSWPRRSRALRPLSRDVRLEAHHLHTATVNKCPINVSPRDIEVFSIMPCEKDMETETLFRVLFVLSVLFAYDPVHWFTANRNYSEFFFKYNMWSRFKNISFKKHSFYFYFFKII